ncbi:hypothetical protein ACF3MZ_26660 [Paenibacillaceae bacterium WGS1546]|uniref:hypothetical protein n=1 Tax=Cohnella sp. WGS1546 TaxID=3366810 RepID=UPI00372D4567
MAKEQGEAVGSIEQTGWWAAGQSESVTMSGAEDLRKLMKGKRNVAARSAKMGRQGELPRRFFRSATGVARPAFGALP